MSNDVEETIVVTFQQLDACLMRAIELSPVTDPSELAELLQNAHRPQRG